MHVHVRVHTCVCMRMCVCVCVCVSPAYVICIYTYHVWRWYVIYISAILIRIPNIKQNRCHVLLCFSGFHFILNHFLEIVNINRFVPVTSESVTICDICDQNMTKPVLLQKLKKKRRNKFGHKVEFVTVCDRHKCHNLVTNSVWLVQTSLRLRLEIRIRRTLIRVVVRTGFWTCILSPVFLGQFVSNYLVFVFWHTGYRQQYRFFRVE